MAYFCHVFYIIFHHLRSDWCCFNHVTSLLNGTNCRIRTTSYLSPHGELLICIMRIYVVVDGNAFNSMTLRIPSSPGQTCPCILVVQLQYTYIVSGQGYLQHDLSLWSISPHISFLSLQHAINKGRNLPKMFLLKSMKSLHSYIANTVFHSYTNEHTVTVRHTDRWSHPTHVFLLSRCTPHNSSAE